MQALYDYLVCEEALTSACESAAESVRLREALRGVFAAYGADAWVPIIEEELDAIEEAGRWYREVLIAVGLALHDVGTPHTHAGSFVASLARQGFIIERNPVPLSDTRQENEQ